ncbi:MAG: hypothetical protein RIN56_17150 [Sporomusaceae bacterium]|nr:hypothetical protein [Sporomusaceae bacterium]
MIDLLTKERIYFSRGQSVIRGRHIPDAIFLAVAAGDDEQTGTVKIGCEIFNNTDGVREIIAKADFNYDEENGKFLRYWKISFKYSINSIQLLEMVVTGLEMALGSSPFLLYASSWQKTLADYYRFMTSPLPKVNYEAVMNELGYGEHLQTPGEIETDDEPDYLIAPYKKRWWAAWVSGDHIVPLFASQAEASRFLRERAACSSLNKVVIGSIPAISRNRMPNPYVLVDHGRSATEKVAWLQTEIDRLRRQSAIRLPEASNNYK